MGQQSPITPPPRGNATITVTFAAACALALYDGKVGLPDVPGCYEREVDATWRVTLNPHDHPVDGTWLRRVPGISAVVERDGKMAIAAKPDEGLVLAPDAERDFLAAVVAVIGSHVAEDLGLLGEGPGAALRENAS